jgi:hypothetical protein
MAKLVNVSVLQPMILKISEDEQYHYKPGMRSMPYDHAQKLGLTRRIRSFVEEPQVEPVAVDPAFIALEAVLEEKTVEFLHKAGYSNFAELGKATQDQLRAIPGIGPARYEEIQAALGRRMSDDGEDE